MAQQKFSAAEREAIWLAHEKKCGYTREMLEVSAMHIDHIIPERLRDNPSAFAEVREKLGLAADFDLQGLENLIPCKQVANLQKGNVLFDPSRAQFFLGIAAAKKDQILKNLEQINARRDRDRALMLLQQCIERGELRVEEVAELLERTPPEIFRLVEGLKFANADEVNRVAKADIDELKRRPIRLGANDHIDGVELTNAAGEKIFVRSCSDYEGAVAKSFYPQTNYDIKTAVFFEHQCGLLRALERATLPSQSFVSDPKVGLADLSLLPISFFPAIERRDGRLPGVDSYQAKIDRGELVVRRLASNLLVIEEQHEGMGQKLLEVARADFNGDGLEDILLFEYCYATHGTLGFGGIRVITRTSPNAMFEEVPLD